MAKRKTIGCPESEAAVLGCIIHNPETLPQAQGILSDLDFLDSANRTIFRHIERLAKACLPFDVVTLMDLVSGDETDLARLMTALGTGRLRWTLDAHARRVAATADAHQLSVQAFALAQRAQGCDPVTDLEGIAAELQALKVRSAKKRRTNADIAAEVLAQATGGAGAAAFSTGISRLDRVLLGGLRRKTVTVIAARPSVGKSALAGNIVDNLRRVDAGPVLLFSLEMGDTPVMQRLAANRADVSARAMTQGTLDPDGVYRLQDVLSGLADDNDLHIIEASGMRIGKIRAEADAWHAVKPLAVVVVDYLQLVGADQPSKMREQDVASVSRGLLAMALQLDCAVVALAQVNRESVKDARPPVMSDLRESGAIEQDANTILFLHRPDDADRTRVEPIVAKQRGGEAGLTVNLHFEGDRQRFTDAVEGGYSRPAGDPLPTYARRQATSNAKASRHDGRYGVDL